jgi:hypothetical protein
LFGGTFVKLLAYEENVMETRVAMEADFIQLLARLISESDDNDPPFKRTGKDLTCSQPLLGRWIDRCDVPFLMDTLALSDHVFGQEFPGIPLSQEDRQAFAKTLENHCRECAPCHAKKAEDIAWKLRIEKAFAENKQAIGDALTKAAGKP